MRKNKVKVKLNIDGIQTLKNEIDKYKKDFDKKCEEFVNKLLEVGISTAYQYSQGVNGAFGTHKMENYVNFTTTLDKSKHGCTGILVGLEKTYFSKWVDSKGNQQTNVIHPLLMLEYGSARFAVPAETGFKEKSMKGSMSQSGHEDDIVWWFATGTDKDGNPTDWKIGTAVTPTQPMYHAWLEVKRKMNEIAKEVFG